MLREGGPLPGPESGLRAEHSEMSCPRRHACWRSKRLYWEGVRVRRAAVLREPGKALCRAAHSLGFYGDGVSFRVVSGQSLWLRGLPRGACVTQPGWIPVRRILGGWQDMWAEVSFWPFPSFSVWWWLVSSAFLTGTRVAGPVSGSPSRYIAIPLKYAAGGWLSLTPGIPPGGGLVAESCPTLTTVEEPSRLLCPWDSGVGCHFLLQRLFLSPGLNPHLRCLLHCRRLLYSLSHGGTPSCLISRQQTISEWDSCRQYGWVVYWGGLLG